MNLVNRKIDFPIVKSSYLEIEPTLWVTLILVALSITCSVDTIIIIRVSRNFRQIS